MKTRYKVLIAAVIAVYAVLILFWIVPLQPDTLETHMRLRSIAYILLGAIVFLNRNDVPGATDAPFIISALLFQAAILLLLGYLYAKGRGVGVIPTLMGYATLNLCCGTFMFALSTGVSQSDLPERECRFENDNRVLLKHLVRFEDLADEYVFFSSDDEMRWSHIYTRTLDLRSFRGADCSNIVSAETEVTYLIDRDYNTFRLVSTSDDGHSWQVWDALEVDIAIPNWCMNLVTIPYVSSPLVWSIQFRCSVDDGAIIRTMDGGRTWNVWGYVRRGYK